MRKSLSRGVIIILIAFASATFVGGQKTPTALKKDLAISPTNADVYREIAVSYRNNPSADLRNKLIFLAVAEIDVNFRSYQRKRRIGKDLFHVLMDILEIGAATAVSITNGARAKSVIGESLAFVQGARASADRNLRLLEMQILFNKMIERRATILGEILEKSSLSEEQYPFQRAYIDIVAYYNAGTWDTALSMLATDTGAAAEAAESLLAAKRAVGINIAPTEVELRTGAENQVQITNLFDQYRRTNTELTEARAQTPPSDEAIKTLKENQEKLRSRMGSIFGLAESDPALRHVMNLTAERSGLKEADKLALEESLRKVRDLSSNPSVADFERVLSAFVATVIERSGRDSTLNNRLKMIIETTK